MRPADLSPYDVCYNPVRSVAACRKTPAFFESLRQIRDEATSLYATANDPQIYRSIQYYDIILSTMIIFDQTVELPDRAQLCREIIGHDTCSKLEGVLYAISCS
jgi:hypothetical protein